MRSPTFWAAPIQVAPIDDGGARSTGTRAARRLCVDRFARGPSRSLELLERTPSNSISRRQRKASQKWVSQRLRGAFPMCLGAAQKLWRSSHAPKHSMKPWGAFLLGLLSGELPQNPHGAPKNPFKMNKKSKFFHFKIDYSTVITVPL